MGAPIAKHLLNAGHALVVTDVSASRAQEFTAAGASFVPSAAAVAAACETIFLSLPGPKEIEAVVLGPNGLARHARRGLVIVDLSTNSRALVVRLAEVLARSGVQYVDAPVSGGVAAATKGTLSVMAGGEEALLGALAPLMACFATKVFRAGATGMGTIAKLVNNQIFLSAAIAVQEGFVLAAKAGLPTDLMMDILSKSSGGAYAGLAPLFLRRDFDNAVFKLGIAAKDVALALESAETLGAWMPMTQAADAVYRASVEAHLGEKVFFATLQTLEARSDVVVPTLSDK
jgi:3-hydroxyisobutyrate dehydrogenase-like beta-hydroxyacid dehydrogenase